MRKLFLLALVIVVGAVLTIVIGNHLSNEAMAVVVGAVCGISASIPVSIALIIASSRGWERDAPSRSYSSQSFVIRSRPTRGDEHRALGSGRIIEVTRK